jgi:hypothetical protein
LTDIPDTGIIGINPLGFKMAIRNFKNNGTEDINYGRATKEAFRTLPKELHRKAQRTIQHSDK